MHPLKLISDHNNKNRVSLIYEFSRVLKYFFSVFCVKISGERQAATKTSLDQKEVSTCLGWLYLGIF